VRTLVQLRTPSKAYHEYGRGALVLRFHVELDAKNRCQGHPNRARMLQPIGNRSFARQTAEEKVRENAGLEGSCDFGVPDRVRSEPDSGIYHVDGGGMKQPGDATGVYVATVPVSWTWSKI
jgi:hypothetical protein